jgi:hypothetical protein
MLASVTGGQSFCGCRALPSIVQMKERVRVYTDSAHATTIFAVITISVDCAPSKTVFLGKLLKGFPHESDKRSQLKPNLGITSNVRSGIKIKYKTFLTANSPRQSDA